MPHRPRLFALLLASSLSLGLAGEAEAHAHLTTATPAIGAIVATPPAELDLRFSEGINLKFTGVTLTGPAGVPVPTGEGKLGPGGDTVLVVPVPGRLAPGTYRVDWHALATDGHKTSGSYGFTVGP